MNGWGTLLWLITCSTGATLFLKLVANAVERSGNTLRTLDERERRAYQRRRVEAEWREEAPGAPPVPGVNESAGE